MNQLISHCKYPKLGLSSLHKITSAASWAPQTHSEQEIVASIVEEEPQGTGAPNPTQAEGEPDHQRQGQERNAWGESREGNSTPQCHVPEEGGLVEPQPKGPRVGRVGGSFQQRISGTSGGRVSGAPGSKGRTLRDIINPGADPSPSRPPRKRPLRKRSTRVVQLVTAGKLR